MHRKAQLLIVAALLWARSNAIAQDTNNGAVVCAESGTQTAAQLVSDGLGGSIVTWHDTRRGGYDIYAQRIGPTGQPLWTYNGIPICTAINDQIYPTIATDGVGGAIITWQDARSGSTDIYAQRVSATGTTLWSFNGVPVCAAPNAQQLPVTTGDGLGGAVIAWQDVRFGGWDIFVQRLNESGVPQWSLDGVALCTGLSDQLSPVIVPDGAHGAIVAWQDYRSGGADIFGQHVSASGATQWTSNGLAFCAAGGQQISQTAVSDSSGGAIVAWQDNRSGNPSIYAQRLNSIGVALWPTDGVALCTSPGGSYSPAAVSNGASGAIVTWQDQRNGGSNFDIYAQQINGAGVPQWTGNGIGVCTVGGNQYGPVVASDGASGAVVAWYDLRSVSQYDIYAQRIGAGGTILWTPDGVALSIVSNSHQYYPTIAPDNAGGAIAVWQDERYTTASDVFSQHVRSDGLLLDWDSEYPRLISVRDIPNDQGGKVKLSWTASNQDLSPFVRIENYWVWRSAPAEAIAAAAAPGSILERHPDGSCALGGRLFMTTLSGGTTYFWEYIASQPAGHLPNYSYVAATTGDSIPGSNPYTAFMIEARTANGAQWWYSNADSGYSKDNLAPAPPASFLAYHLGNATQLHWATSSEADFGVYRLYRGSTADFEPGPATLLAAQPDTGYADQTRQLFYYKLSVVDVHGNESAYAFVYPGNTTGVPIGTTHAGVWLGPIAPNPARGEAVIQFRLPESMPVSLGIYDLGGRRVRDLVSGIVAAGDHSLTWDGTDSMGRAMPNALYFFRLESGGIALTRQLTLMR